MRERLGRRLAIVVAAAVPLVAGALVVSAQAAPTAGCTVSYSVGAQWQGGFLADVVVHNLGEPIYGWRLGWSFTAGQRVLQSWGASSTQSGSQVTATAASWSSALPTGGSARIGLVGTMSGTVNPAPSSFSLNGTTCTDGNAPAPSPSSTSTASPVPSATTAAPSPSTTATSSTMPANGGTSTGAWPPSAQFSNPVLWEDFPDGDVIRVGDTYYYSASNMHYSPGAPILRSYDLVHWEMAGHSVPRLDFSPAYDLNGGRAYIKGTWASFLNYRAGNKTFYWGGCVEFNKTHIYTAASVDGTWQRKATINNCYYDAGMLIDDDDTMYVAYGNTNISVAQLSKDGTSQVRAQQVFTSPGNVGTIEGSRFYKINGSYYIFVTHPADGEYVLKSNNPFGPYTMQPLLNRIGSPIAGGGVPHQGGIVQTAAGDWYYAAFVDAYPGGRVPVVAPITWSADGWPRLQLVNNAWGSSYPYPNVPRPPREVKPPTGTDTFAGTTLAPDWEWNHNPDNTKWSSGSGLTLQTATVTNDLYSARNTLTHRILGPSSTATISLDFAGMKDGDRAGLAMLRDSSAWVGLKRDGANTRLTMVNNLTMDKNWNTTGTGTEVADAPVSGNRVWLRVKADIRPGQGRQATFWYSTDGTQFVQLGSGFTLGSSWEFFPGYRFAMFNYATRSLGGSVKVDRFDLTTP